MFEPLLYTNLFIFSALLVGFHIIGNSFLSVFVKPNLQNFKTYFISIWIIGFAVFFFLIFFLGFFGPLNTFGIISLYLVLFSIALYLRYKNGTISLVKSDFLNFILLATPLVPYFWSVFIKASQPPYFSDEMSYHFPIPSAIEDGITWANFMLGSSVFSMMPRTLDLSYLTGFTVFKTFSLNRLFNFFIFASSLLAGAAGLKKIFGTFFGFVSVFLFLSMTRNVSFTGTTGFVDVPVYGLIFLCTVLLIHLFESEKTELTILFASFWGMIIGIKYTGLTSFSVSFLFFLLLFIKFKHFQTRKVIIAVLAGFIVCGSYWYLKNLIYTGNPIYPFIFPCFRYQEFCPAKSSFFGGWTLPVSLSGIPTILSQLLSNVSSGKIPVLIAILTGLFTAFKTKKLHFALPIFLLFAELIIQKFLSGFFLRYHLHMRFYLILQLVIFLVALKEYSIQKWIKAVLCIPIAIYFYDSTGSYWRNLKMAYAEIKPYEQSFAMNSISFDEWLKKSRPQVLELVNWCRESAEKENLSRVDPSMIWNISESSFESYTKNCRIVGEKTPILLDRSELKKWILENNSSFYFVSKTPCLEEKSKLLELKNNWQRKDQKDLVEYNQNLVCLGKKVVNLLYKIDYKDLSKPSEARQ